MLGALQGPKQPQILPLHHLTVQWRKGKSSDSDSSVVTAGLEEVQGRVMGALRGSSGQSAFRFVIVEAPRASWRKAHVS